MTFEITKRHIPRTIAAIALLFFAGYGVGNIGAKLVNHLSAEAAPQTIIVQ
ncbi:hypothetical protein [Aurantiacibacter sediminis]|uniref:Efflux RND transporter periplasmic adaptor subunit n=1 Tax=Aurantiacibacter sediminis TaxID=2793064 RepID=A0ABS0N4S0_9SPHN|nr:hypothetical protein [Aurantiacibacter sediminis]MBH5322661.1 hypothetical protein [Aurantiacibacter sediminis]